MTIYYFPRRIHTFISFRSAQVATGEKKHTVRHSSKTEEEEEEIIDSYRGEHAIAIQSIQVLETDKSISEILRRSFTKMLSHFSRYSLFLWIFSAVCVLESEWIRFFFIFLFKNTIGILCSNPSERQSENWICRWRTRRKGRTKNSRSSRYRWRS